MGKARVKILGIFRLRENVRVKVLVDKGVMDEKKLRL